MTTTIYLLRHAETAANVPGHEADGSLARPGELLYAAFEDAPLTPRGLRQAQRVAERLSACPLAAVYSSPFRRARQTAEAVAQGHDLAVSTDDALVERDFGEWDGLAATEIAERYPPGVTLFDSSAAFAPPGGESLQDVAGRMRPALGRVAERHPGGEVAVVSHKTAIRAVLCHILGTPLHRFRRIGQDNCALNVLNVGPEDIGVVAVNDTCPLEGLGD